MIPSGKQFPIMVKVWAGWEQHDFYYLRRSLPSLLASDLPASARVILINDCSLDRRVEGFLASLAASQSQVEVWTNPRRMGPDEGQAYNFPRVVERYPEASHYVLCDDDILYHPRWLQRLIQICEESKTVGLRGVFTALNVPFRPSYKSVQLPTSEVLLKERQAALNWLVPREIYEAVGPFRDVGIAYDTNYCDRMAVLGIPVICLKPSYVQNIGYHGAYQDDDSFTAKDYVGQEDWRLRAYELWYRLRRFSLKAARWIRRRLTAMTEAVRSKP